MTPLPVSSSTYTVSNWDALRCPGRRRVLSHPTPDIGHPTSSIQNNHTMTDSLIDRYVHAEHELAFWTSERKRLGTLTAPRTDWMVLSWRYKRGALREAVEAKLDQLIPDSMIYTDLFSI